MVVAALGLIELDLRECVEHVRVKFFQILLKGGHELDEGVTA